MKKLMMIFVVMIMMAVGANTAYAKEVRHERRLSYTELIDVLEHDGWKVDYDFLYLDHVTEITVMKYRNLYEVAVIKDANGNDAITNDYYVYHMYENTDGSICVHPYDRKDDLKPVESYLLKGYKYER